MRWQAFQGSLPITYPSGDGHVITYPYLPSQIATVSTLWSNVASSDPLTDMKTFANTIANNSGYYGTKFHMGSDTYELLTRNATIKALLTDYNRSSRVPTYGDVINFLRDGTEIVIYDGGYRDDTAVFSRALPTSLTRFLPFGKVLVTTDYTIAGDNIAETCDGQVIVGAGYNQAAIVQGGAAETILEPITKTHLLRVASARVPRFIYPECFLFATVA